MSPINILAKILKTQSLFKRAEFLLLSVDIMKLVLP
jgi:hypothetical protein